MSSSKALTPSGAAREEFLAVKTGANRTDGSVGPYSKWLRRGSLGLGISASSKEGRFLRDFESQLVEHLGGQPSATERALIVRCAKIALRLEFFDQRIAAGTMTEFDTKVYSSLLNNFRLYLKQFGFKPAAPCDPSQPDPHRTGRGVGLADLMAQR